MIQSPFSDSCGRRGAVAFGRLALMLLLSGGLPAVFAQSAAPAAGTGLPAALVGELRGGGFVIYIRHASTILGSGDEQNESLDRCETQRNLSDKGRSDALQIGKSLRGLGIPVGPVLSSPYCRARDTAALAFGHYLEDPDLAFVMGANADETRRRAERLRQMLGSPPDKGVNSVIVSHSANLYEAAGIFAKPEGAIYIFKPLGGGRFEQVGRILPEELGDVARKAAPLPARMLAVPAQ